MQPMGFIESIFFGFVVLIMYGVIGITVMIIHPRYQNERNQARLCGAIVIWPIIVAIATMRGIRIFASRLYRDALEVAPKKQAKIPPKRVTVEMLAADKGTEYQPGQWAN